MEQLPKNTYYVTVTGSGLPEVDGLYVPSTAPPAKSESGTESSLGYWNGKMAWDRADGKAARSPSLSYSNSYNAWRLCRLDGHLAYDSTTEAAMPPTDVTWNVYKKGVAPAPKVTLHEADPRIAGANVMMHASGDFKAELMKTAKEICAPGKGILAADESTGTIGKRFDGISVENNHANRQAYRELLFTAPGLEEYISGVIMYDETVRDTTVDGKQKFTELLRSRGIHCGIKVDTGLQVIGGTKEETATQGLDGLGARCAEYYKMGCRFAKWRAVLKIDPANGLPSKMAIQETAHSLARYGSICQQNGLVPIIEPEILQDGDHSIEVCAAVSEKVFSAVMTELFNQRLLIEGLLLKPNMVTPGASCPQRASPQEIAWYTVRTLSRTIVPALPGVTFLSGGQSEEDASLNLNAMNQITAIPRPWSLTFSYGRALQSSVLKAWQGKAENVAAAQAVLLTRAKSNGLANLGKYEGGSGSTASDFVANYRY